jgi:hypothetical protein
LETVRENITILAKDSLGYYDLKKHKQWFNKGSSLLNQMKEAELQWLQDLNKINEDTLSSVRSEASRYFRNKIEGISARQNQ